MPPQSGTISIPKAYTSSDPKPYTIYDISVRQPLRSTTVSKRYSDFTTLHSALTSQAGAPPPTALPAKNWLRSTVSSPVLTEERRRGLESYLIAISTASDARWRNTSAWRSFLNLPGGGSGASATPSASGGSTLAELRVPVTDPTAWLDVQRDLKNCTRDARASLARREQARSAQEEHEAAAEAKRQLVRMGTMISALETGLSSMSGGSGGEKAVLGDGELRRRRDLLAAARRDRDALEEQAGKRPARGAAANNTADATLSPVGSTPKEQLLADGASRGRRVLGGGGAAAAAKETEQTRELDNAEVLQLQQQIMGAQDADVEDLTAVVRRMREMGVAINEELVLQGEMLDVLDRDVDRVGSKVGVAKKRIGKIK